MMRRIIPLFLVLTMLLVAAPALAQGTIEDGRLNTGLADPIVIFCRYDNGLEAFVATGGVAFDVSRIQIQGALAQALLDNTTVQVTAGPAGARVIAYPDGGLGVTANGGFQYTVKATDCGGFQPDYTVLLGMVNDLVTNIQEQPTAAVTTTTTLATTTVSGRTTHTVQRGENLYRIGLRYGVHYTTIANANGIANPNTIYAGQVLNIP